MTLWYVDNALGTGSNNGTSWANAWRTIGTISWGSIAAGDTVYLSGGTTTQSYTGSGSTTILTVGASGSAGNPITIRGGVDAGHNGSAIIDGQSGGRDCLDIISRTNVTIQNLTLQNPGGGFDCIWCTGCGNIIIQNNTIHVGGTSSNTHSVGVDVRSTTAAVTVRANYVDTAVNFLDQTDCIYAQNCVDGLLIDGNDIHQLNWNSNGHNDGIQLGFNNNSTISNNYIEVPIGGANVHGMLLSDPNTTGSKTYTVFNNVINATSGAITCILLQNTTQTGKFLIYNNTIYNAGSVAWGISLASLNVLSEIKNNIIWVIGASGVGINNAGWTPTSSNQIDYNDIFTSGGAASFSGTTTGWNTAHGISADPLFISNGTDFHLQSTSLCKNAGVTEAVVTTDKDGIARPQGSVYDIGAYEFNGSTFQVSAGLSGVAALAVTALYRLLARPSANGVGAIAVGALHTPQVNASPSGVMALAVGATHSPQVSVALGGGMALTVSALHTPLANVALNGGATIAVSATSGRRKISSLSYHRG